MTSEWSTVSVQTRLLQDLLERLGCGGARGSEDRGLQVEVGSGPEGTVEGVASVGNDAGIKVHGQEPGSHCSTWAVGCHPDCECLSCSRHRCIAVRAGGIRLLQCQ